MCIRYVAGQTNILAGLGNVHEVIIDVHEDNLLAQKLSSSFYTRHVIYSLVP